MSQHEATWAYTIRIHEEPGQDMWADVAELPGCFVTARDLGELTEALTEAISLYLDQPVRVELTEQPGTVTERQLIACPA